MLTTLAGDTPDGNEARERLARAYAASGDAKKASELVDQTLKWDPRNTRALVFKGHLLAANGNRAEAIVVLRNAASSNPKSIGAQFMLGSLYSAAGDTAAAEKAFREVLRLNPRAAAAQIELSRLQRKSGNVEASLQTAEAAAKNLPQSLEVRLALVRSLLAANDTKRAGVEIAKLLEEYPTVPEVIVQSGVLAVVRKDYAGARTKFEKALQLNASSVEAITGLVLLDIGARDFAAAKDRIQSHMTAPGRKPNAGLLLLAARTYIAVGELDPAEQYLRQAIELEPTLLRAYATLGQLYLKQRKLEQARLEFDRLAQRHTHPVGALTMSGIILEAQGKGAEARKRYEQALATDPRAGVAANNLAWLHLQSGENLDVALQLAQTAMSVMPEVPEVLDTLGWIYYKKNLPAQAVPHLLRCVEKQPRNAVYRYHLGVAQLLSGSPAEGQKSLQHALTMSADFPGSDDARQKLAESKTAK